MRGTRSAVAFSALVLSGAAVSAAIAQVALPEAVESTPLSRDAFSTGTLDSTNGALPPTLWQGADPQTIDYLLMQAPAHPATHSLGQTLRRTLLSSGAAPDGASPSLGGKKLLALANAGFVDEARTIASLTTVGGAEPWTAQAIATVDLLAGNVGNACQRNASLGAGRDELFWVKLRVLCYARADERDASDLTLNILREQGALANTELTYLTAVATGVPPESTPVMKTALEYAIARSLSLPFTPSVIAKADGGVLTAIARDDTVDPATRIAAAENAVAMGVLGIETLTRLLQSVDFDTVEISDAATAARANPGDPLTDALLYQSIESMNAPEFIRDKAQRIALALSLADSFHRAYALSQLYAEDVSSLEGVLVTPEEAAHFATARMGVGDSVGAGYWLAAMIGSNSSIDALPQPVAMAFFERVNLLSVLDPQTAARIARSAGVSLLGKTPAQGSITNGHDNQAVMARIVDAAFDAAAGGKTGQAALVALAASNGDTDQGGEVEAVIIEQSLRVAGLSDLGRRYEFEQAWAGTFASAAPATGGDASNGAGTNGDGELTPRLKPRGSR